MRYNGEFTYNTYGLLEQKKIYKCEYWEGKNGLLKKFLEEEKIIQYNPPGSNNREIKNLK